VRHLVSIRLAEISPVSVPAYFDTNTALRHLASQLGEDPDDVLRLARQHELTTATSDEHGRFSLKKLKKGKYEVLFQRSGFDPFSVIVRVDSSVPCKKVCVNLCVSGACFEKPRFEQCE